MKTNRFKQPDNLREIRKKSGLNQSDFWGKLGITQSGGSRYESGRKLPQPLLVLFCLTYLEHIDLSKINQDDITIAALLKKQMPDLYAELKKESRAAFKNH